jgi:phosphoenolpyruvate---glycerone phosphotransferase subunit DhaL
MGIVCNSHSLVKTVNVIAEKIISQKAYLTDLDACIGDADHGINLCRGFAAVKSKLAEVQDGCAGTILKTVGMTLVSTVGGASGPLYGTAFIYAGNLAMRKYELTDGDVVELFAAALEGIIKRGHASVGDKTMVDTLSPVVDYLKSETRSEPNWGTVMNQVLEVARQGMESTLSLMALKGRASFLKERSVGHLDPGAVSCFLMIQAIAGEARNGG